MIVDGRLTCIVIHVNSKMKCNIIHYTELAGKLTCIVIHVNLTMMCIIIHYREMVGSSCQLDNEVHYCSLQRNGRKLTCIVIHHKTKFQIIGRGK
jgi:hypothetical protein